MINSPQIDYRTPQIQYGSVERPDIDFRSPQMIENDFSLLGVGEKFMSGIFHGFTTINLSQREPDNVAEGLAQSMGTWLGITGMVFTGPKGWGTRMLAQGGSRGVRMATSLSQNNFKSVPMWVGDKVVSGVRGMQNQMGSPAMRAFTRDHSMTMDAIEGATRIGTAMGVINWQEGVDAMLMGGALGAFFGGSDRVIGNAIRQMRPALRGQLKGIEKLSASEQATRLRKAERVVSAVSAGIVSGMPSTIMGQPWEYQVYDYLFGAWLGAEPSYAMRTAHSFIGRARAAGKENDIMDPNTLRKMPEYRDMMKRNRNPKLREAINEEITAQVEFTLGQKINNSNRAAIIAAMAHSAADAGNISAEKMVELNQAIYAETLDGMFLQEGMEKYKSQAMSDGMSENAAEAFAINRIRGEYANWRRGQTDGEVLQQISEKIEFLDLKKKDYELFRPVVHDGEVGIITQMDTDGNILQVLANDGIELVKGGKAVSKKQRTELRSKTDQVIPMSKDEFINKIVAWRYRVDEDGQFVNQGPGGDKLDVDPRMWEIYPDVAANYQQPHFRIDKNGNFIPGIAIGNRAIAELPGQYKNERDAYTASLNYLAQDQAYRRLMRDPALMFEGSVLGKLAEAYSNMDYDNRSFPILNVVRDIIQSMDASGKLKEGSELYSQPIKLYDKLYSSLQKTKDYNHKRQELTKELYKARRDQSENRDQRIANAEAALANLKTAHGYELGWKGFLRQMSEQYPMKKENYWDMKNPMVKELRKWHKRNTYEKVISSLAIKDGKLQKIDQFPNGQRNVNVKAPSFLQRTLHAIDPGADLIHIDKVWNADNFSVEGLSSRADKLSDYNQLLADAYADGQISREYYIYSGVKDKDTLRAVPYMFGDRNSAMKYLNRRISALGKNNKKAAKGIRESLKGKDADFIRQFASNMRIWEKINSDMTTGYKYPIEVLANESGFINTVSAFNKRLQILDAEGMVADPEFYTNIDGSPKTEFRSIIIRAQNKSKKHPNQAEGVEEFRNRGNIDPDKLADQHKDGAVIVNQRTFDQMKADGGLDDLSGAIKGITAFSDDKGGFLSKKAFFRADDTTQSFMEKHNLDYLENTTTAKQSGDRMVYDYLVRDDGTADVLYNSRPVKNPQVFDTPIDGVTINSGQSENIASAMKAKRIPIQMLQTFSPHVMDANIARQMIAEIMSENNVTGDAEASVLANIEGFEIGRFDKPLAKKALASLRDQTAKIDIDNLSTKDLFEIMKGGYAYEQSGMYDRLIREIYSKKEDIISETMQDGDVESALDLMNSDFSSMLDTMVQVTEASGDLLTSAMLESKGIKQYADAVTRNYMINRTMRPKVDYALKSIGSQQDAAFLQKFGRVEEGEFMLGQAAKDMKVKVGFRDTTLGEAHDRLTSGEIDVEIRLARNKESLLAKELEAFKGSGGKQQQAILSQWRKAEAELRSLTREKQALNEAMEMVITRVPIEHASGVRALRFKGFSDESGVTSKLNPRDMENLGGMDLDIDSVFVFQNMGKTRYVGEDGVARRGIDELKSSKVKDYWYNEDGTFRDPKSEEMRKLWNAKHDDTSNFADMFNPDKLFEAGRATASANQALGQVVNARRDLLAALDSIPTENFSSADLNLSKKQRSFLKKALGTDNFRVTFTKKDNAEAIIDEVARAGINLSADAADLTSFIGKFDIKAMMHGQAYDIKITGVKGSEVDPTSYESAVDMIRKNSPVMKMMQEANSLLSGRYKDETNLNAYEVATQLRHINQNFKEHTGVELSKLHGSYYKGIENIINANIHYRPMDNWSLQRIENFFKVGRDFTKANSNISKLYKQTLEELTGTKRKILPNKFFDFLNEYNTIAKKFHNGEGDVDILDVRTAYRNMQEMMANEINDLASAMTLYKEHYSLLNEGVQVNGKKVTTDDLISIFNTASSFKHAIYQAKKKTGNREPRFADAEMALRNWSIYREGLDPALRRYADYSMMSTLFKPSGKPPKYSDDPQGYKDWHAQAKWTNSTHQSEVMKYMTPLHVKEFFDIHRHISEIPKQIHTENVEITVGNQTREVPAVEAHLRSMIQDATAGEMTLEFPYDYYDAPAPKRVDMRIDEIKKRSAAKYDSKRAEQLAQDDHPSYRSIASQKARLLKDLGDHIAEGGEFKLSTEEQMIFNELKDMFSKHPQLSAQFDRVFLGENAMTRRDGRAKHLEDANLDDMRKFLAAVNGHYHGDIMDGKLLDKIPKWMYWMVPDKYHRQYAGIDLRLDDITIHTINGKTEKAKVISSPAKRLVNMSNTMQMNSVIRQSQMSIEFNKMVKPLSEAMGDHFDPAWRFAVVDRIVRKGSPSQYVSKLHAQYQKEMGKLQNEVYNIDGEQVSMMDMIPRFDKAITRANKLAWKVVRNPDADTYYYGSQDRWINAETTIARMNKSILDGDYQNLWIPDTYTLNNIIMGDYVHAKLRAKHGDDTPRKGSDDWIAMANRYIQHAGMNDVVDLPRLPFESYYPQRNHSKKALAQWQIDQKNQRNILSADNTREASYAAMRLHEDNGILSKNADDMVLSQLLGLAGDATPKNLDVGEGKLPGHLRHRSRPEDQIPDWDPGIRSYFEYIESMVSNNMNKALAIAGKHQINSFERVLAQNYGGEGKHYADFLRLYLSDQVMNQTMVPQSWADNYSALNLKSSGYYYFTDRYYTQLDAKISKMLGTKPILGANDPERAFRLAELSNLEAKYSLITLLSRPKAAVMNLYGGATILASDVGITNMQKGWSLKHIRKINPEITSWDDAVRFAEVNGAMESLVRNEVMNHQAWGNSKSRRGLTAMLDAIKADPTVSDLKLTEIAKKHGLSDSVFNLAALPMRYSERVLRSRSFFAHYIKAVETLELSGPSAYNHPWALEMARRGVATTQFMYNNANRPAWTRSNVGKIFARFKMWAIKSVKFRADAFNELASDMKYNVQDPATQKRFNDVMMMDMFMVALAGLFPFSVFGNAIPEPFAWMDELVKWAFGDPEEKQKSFRGGGGLPTALAPLSVTMPPSARLLTSWIEPVMKDEAGALAGYTVWTMFPFGLLARDSRNALRNPGRAVDSLTGIPLSDALGHGYGDISGVRNESILPAFSD